MKFETIIVLKTKSANYKTDKIDIYFEDLKDTVEDGNKLREKLIELTENNEEVFVKNF